MVRQTSGIREIMPWGNRSTSKISAKEVEKVQHGDRFTGQRKNRDLELVTMAMTMMMAATMPMMMVTMEEWKTW